jgi:multisubunit Na+/H+ antiporter MnhF subunit
MQSDGNMTRRTPRYLLILAMLSVLLTLLACDWSIDFGITCLHAADSELIAFGFEEYNGIPHETNDYISTDGGLHWHSGPGFAPDPTAETACDNHVPTLLTSPRDGRVQYRFTPEGAVDRSEDGGQTWQRELDSLALSEAEAVYHDVTRAWLATRARREPQDAVIDMQTDNVIVALGQAGVMVRTAEGHWQHVTVGAYVYEAIDLSRAIHLLAYNLWLAVAVTLMTCGLACWLATGTRWWHVTFGPLACLTWLVMLFLSSALRDMFTSSSLKGGVLFFFALPWGIMSVNHLSRLGWRALLIAVAGAVANAILFCAPFFLWAWAKVPSYDTALVYALLLVVATIVITAYFLQGELARIDLAQRPTESEPM